MASKFSSGGMLMGNAHCIRRPYDIAIRLGHTDSKFLKNSKFGWQTRLFICKDNTNPVGNINILSSEAIHKEECTRDQLISIAYNL